MKNFFVTMSGGTTQVINATLVGLIRGIREHYPQSRIYAGFPGVIGALDENYVELSAVDGEELLRLYRTPASGYIGTTRVKILEENDFNKLSDLFSTLSVGFFLNIGGSGTIKQTKAIYERLGGEITVAALPKTVDNDFGDESFDDVLFTPGFPSCANYWRHKTAVMNLESLGAYSHDKVLVAQTFGRKTGFLAACARLADTDRKLPLTILLPEDQRATSAVLDRIREQVSTHSRSIVIMTEGYEIGSYEKKHDPSGQIMYGSSRTTAAQLLVNACVDSGVNARAFVPGFDQRSEMRFTSSIDLESAYGVGLFAIRQLAEGEEQFFATVCRNDNALNGIGFKCVPLGSIGNFGRAMPERWIKMGGYDVEDAFIRYLEPLIGVGQLPVPNDGQNLYFAYPSVCAQSSV